MPEAPANLLVCGIAVLDHVHRMDVLPRGGLKHRSRAHEVIGGGCGANAAVAAARLGGAVTLCVRLGADAAGDALAGLLAGRGPVLACPRGGRQPVSAVMIDAGGERMIVNYPGANLPEAVPDLPACDAVLTDGRWPAAARAALADAARRGVPAVLDAERHVPPDLAAMATHVVFSAPGLRDFAGTADLDAALGAAAARLPGRVGYTDGPRGVAWDDGATHPASPVAAVDTLGAGDVWHGAFALALARGLDLGAASRAANAAAAAKCARAGGWDAYPTAADMAGMAALPSPGAHL